LKIGFDVGWMFISGDLIRFLTNTGGYKYPPYKARHSGLSGIVLIVIIKDGFPLKARGNDSPLTPKP